MSNLTMPQRRRMSLTDFADPRNRKFPVMDQSDMDAVATLYGRSPSPEMVKRNAIAIAKRKGLKLPESWESGADTDADSDDRPMRPMTRRR